MPSYVVTGASRGIGLEYVRQLSASPENIVFALVRNIATTVAVPSSLLKSPPANVHVIEADVTDHKALKRAAGEVAELTGGSLDVLINNAAAINGDNDWRSLLDFEGEDELLETEFERAFKVNVVGVIHSTNSFLPLLRKGRTKKVATISSAGSDRNTVLDLGITQMTAYGASKAALNLVVAKFAISLQKEGIIIVALGPGLVDTSKTTPGVPKNSEWITDFMETMVKKYPHSPGMITPDVSVKKQLEIIDGRTLQDSGGFFSIWGQYRFN